MRVQLLYGYMEKVGFYFCTRFRIVRKFTPFESVPQHSIVQQTHYTQIHQNLYLPQVSWNWDILLGDKVYTKI